jgi:hypothetical protein
MKRALGTYGEAIRLWNDDGNFAASAKLYKSIAEGLEEEPDREGNVIIFDQECNSTVELSLL